MTVVPVVVVFTRYDRLVTSKKAEIFKKNPKTDRKLLEEAAQQGAEKTYKEACDSIKPEIPVGIPCVYVSGTSHDACAVSCNGDMY